MSAFDVGALLPRRGGPALRLCACSACCAVDPSRRALRGGPDMAVDIFARLDRLQCPICKRRGRGGRLPCSHGKENPDA